MKNTEWGAVAYLQQSEYGSHKRVRINNNSSYLTGYAGKHEPTIGYTKTIELCSVTPEACNEISGSEKGRDGEYNTNYFNKASVVASTTGNYSGIYDMSGGAWEYVMAGMEDGTGSGMFSSGRHNIYNSGFNGLLTCPTCDTIDGKDSNIKNITDGIEQPRDERYYDKYEYSLSNTNYYRGILGDATKEMGPFYSVKYKNELRLVSSWYTCNSWHICASTPWVDRGGVYDAGTDSGLFNFASDRGHATAIITFRLVLAF